jgi:hypothetical protein
MASLEDAEVDIELANLAKILSKNPKTRTPFLRMVRDIQPDVPMPEIDIEDRVNSIQSAAETRISELEGRLRQREAEDTLEQRRRALIESGKAASKQDVDAIEKLMLERQIHSHETAAELYGYQRQEAARPTPTNYNTGFMDSSTRDVLKAYYKNPVQAARDEAAKAFSELRGPRRPIGLG